MPVQEAPNCFGDSSPDASLSQEFPAPELPAAAIFVQQHQQHQQHVFHYHQHQQQQQQYQPHPQQQQQQRLLTPEPRLERLFNPQQHQIRLLPRITSYDRDIPRLEEENHWPSPPVHLLPVTLPQQQAPEPSLDELLRRVTEREDLQNVVNIRLRVISYTLSLSRLSLFLPNLQSLDLSGSVLSSLRDLGCLLVNLSILNVSNCGLNSFDGTSGFPGLRELVADGNMIQRVDPLSELTLLTRLSAKNNCIRDLGLLSFLGMCANLVEIELQGNPVCHLNLYRVTLQRSVPTLELLDNIPITDSNVNAQNYGEATDSEVSSLSSDICYESGAAAAVAANQTTDALITQNRPSTAPINANERNNSGRVITLLPRRPATVTESTRRASLSSCPPLQGSIMELVRRRRRRSEQAWHSVSTSSSSSGSNQNSGSYMGTNSFCSTRQSSFSSNSGESFEQPAALPVIQYRKILED